MLEDSFSDNMRQAKVVMRYELKKYFRGKRIAIFAVLMGFVLLMLTALPYLFGDGLSSDPNELAFSYTSALQILIVVLAALFISGAIVSEFEDRTALMLFTKPMKKWSVFLGKLVSACAIGFMFVTVYYAVIAGVSLIVTGSVASSMLTSIGLALAYTVGTAGVAVLISSMVKKTSTAAVLTFVLLFMIFMMISQIMTANSIDPWFMLDVAGNGINDSLTQSAAYGKSAAVMLVWGLVTSAAGYVLFRRRGL
jgi:ABC-2 type transport system permease protein